MGELSQLLLREGTEADLPATLGVLQAAFEEYRAWLDPPSGVHRETVASLGQELARGQLTLALHEDAIVGCVFSHVEGDHLYFGRLAVLPEFRNRGIAGALIAAVEARARDLGLHRVRLSVRVAQADNRARYERMGYGFVEARSHAGYREPTFVVLEKALLP
jgi:ribosomal protein S18 acetylase RimI-like enzyme